MHRVLIQSCIMHGACHESPGGTFWVSAADGGVSFVYDQTGIQVIPAVNIPSHLKNAHGNPTGQIFNGTADFVIPGTGEPAKFIFASEDGTISGWNGGPSAILLLTEVKKMQAIKALLWLIIMALIICMLPILQRRK